MRRLRVAVRREDGVAMVLVVALYAMLVLLAVTLIATVLAEGTRSATAVRRDAAFQAAEAGIDDYTAKLVDDHGYYAHYVHPGESTREAAGTTAMASFPSIRTITHLASSFPETCADSATSWAVKAREWLTASYLTWWLSRNSFSFLTGMVGSLSIAMP